jgi:hypothetical protein
VEAVGFVHVVEVFKGGGLELGALGMAPALTNAATNAAFCLFIAHFFPANDAQRLCSRHFAENMTQ